MESNLDCLDWGGIVLVYNCYVVWSLRQWTSYMDVYGLGTRYLGSRKLCSELVPLRGLSFEDIGFMSLAIKIGATRELCSGCRCTCSFGSLFVVKVYVFYTMTCIGLCDIWVRMTREL